MISELEGVTKTSHLSLARCLARSQIILMGCEIVLVDDDPEFSASMASMLEDEGYEVHLFSTPEAAFDWLLTGGSASLVLLDLRTPGMSAQRFRALLMSTP